MLLSCSISRNVVNFGLHMVLTWIIQLLCIIQCVACLCAINIWMNETITAWCYVEWIDGLLVWSIGVIWLSRLWVTWLVEFDCWVNSFVDCIQMFIGRMGWLIEFNELFDGDDRFSYLTASVDWDLLVLLVGLILCMHGFDWLIVFCMSQALGSVCLDLDGLIRLEWLIDWIGWLMYWLVGWLIELRFLVACIEWSGLGWVIGTDWLYCLSLLLGFSWQVSYGRMDVDFPNWVGWVGSLDGLTGDMYIFWLYWIRCIDIMFDWLTVWLDVNWLVAWFEYSQWLYGFIAWLVGGFDRLTAAGSCIECSGLVDGLDLNKLSVLKLLDGLIDWSIACSRYFLLRCQCYALFEWLELIVWTRCAFIP